MVVIGDHAHLHTKNEMARDEVTISSEWGRVGRYRWCSKREGGGHFEYSSKIDSLPSFSLEGKGSRTQASARQSSSAAS